MSNGDWLERLPVIGRLPPDEAVAKLWAIGEDELADALAASQQDPSIAYGSLSRLRIGMEKAWLHTAHTIGYLAPVQGRLPGVLPIRHATDIVPDETLRGVRVKLTLDGLRVADYPGHGVHRIWFDFAARNQTSQGTEQLHFNLTCRVADSERASVIGRPIFSGLKVGGEGIFLQFATVNVLNESDEKLLDFLESGVFTGGLQLLSTAQPAVGPLSALALGLTEMIASRSRNVPVQAVDLGLDFSAIATRPRLVVQSRFRGLGLSRRGL